MRVMLFSLILATPRYKINHRIIAVLLPLFSFVVSGHPIFVKSVIMSVELLINVLIFHWMMEIMSVFKSVALSVIIAKVIYYMLKGFLIGGGLLKMNLISTDIVIQLVVLLLVALLFKFVYPVKNA